MKTLMVLVFVFFLSLPFSHSKLDSQLPIKGFRGESKVRPRPCCNNCGGCTKSNPPQCQCLDLVKACHPLCKECVRSPLSVYPVLYQCMDRITNFCKYRCSNSKSREEER